MVPAVRIERTTFRAMLLRLGVLPNVAELCMIHQETESMRREYDGHDYSQEMAEACDRGSSWRTYRGAAYRWRSNYRLQGCVTAIAAPRDRVHGDA